ncbi:Peptidase, M16 family [Desulfonema limicola]|uniref:Peptidase, M16 family n=1 Tax=Desulfonema limicola TaxID=45656 RepID=A0A975GEW3_9BACT|nr:pitrilysin family protein [Desulfonema limicola]QTA78642.1 Peptidase, M16 family [Desulfonema limicola]
MPVNKTILPNGVRILTQKIPHVRSISLGIWVNAGSRDESPAQSGLSHFIEHMIFKGTSRRSSYQIAKEFDSIGGHSNAFTAMENTCFHAKVIDSHMESMVDILSDIFLNSIFDPTELERERTVILQEIDMQEDSPEEYIHVLAEQSYWGDHPLGRPIIGPRENILSFDSSIVRDFFLGFYQPERIVISAAGNIEHNQLVDLMGQAFSLIKPGNSLSLRDKPEGKTGISITEKDLGQTHICLETPGISVVDSRRYAGSLMNTILGGNMSSRLFQEIRERRGLAYSVYSFMSSYTDTGLSGIYIGTHPDKAYECTDLILQELKKIRKIPVSEAELNDAREYTRSALLLASESVDSQMVRIAQNEIHLGHDLALEDIIKEIDLITTEHILSLAQELFSSPPVTLTLLGQVSDPGPYEDLLSTY